MDTHASLVRTRLRTLRPILAGWVECNLSYCDGWPEAGWWYNERTSVGFLAGAAWKSGGVALEEYSTGKGRGRDAYRGRCDLYLRTGKRGSSEFLIEAKHLSINVGTAGAGYEQIDARLREAVQDVRACRDECQNQLGAVFAVPKYSVRPNMIQQEGVDSWFAGLKVVRADGMAWVRHGRWQELDGGDGTLFPGIELFVRLDTLT